MHTPFLFLSFPFFSSTGCDDDDDGICMMTMVACLSLANNRSLSTVMPVMVAAVFVFTVVG